MHRCPHLRAPDAQDRCEAERERDRDRENYSRSSWRTLQSERALLSVAQSALDADSKVGVEDWIIALKRSPSHFHFRFRFHSLLGSSNVMESTRALAFVFSARRPKRVEREADRVLGGKLCLPATTIGLQVAALQFAELSTATTFRRCATPPSPNDDDDDEDEPLDAAAGRPCARR